MLVCDQPRRLAGPLLVSPAVLQQRGVNPGLFVLQLAGIPLPPVLPLRLVHFLRDQRGLFFILKANIKPETWFWLVVADSPTRPARPWQLCLSSGGSLHPGPRRATAINPTRGSAHNTHQYSLIYFTMFL